jgi:E3 ubiquitin ligase
MPRTPSSRTGRLESVDPGDIYTLLFVGLVGVALASWLMSPAAKLRRELKRAPRVTLRELRESTRARVVGAAHPLEGTLSAPLTGRACLYYVVIVEQYRPRGGGARYWRQILRDELGVPFLLDDGTGRAIVDPRAAKVALDVDVRSNSGTFNNPSLRENAFLQKHGQSSEGWIFNKRLRYREAVIEVGETVAILGEGVREPDPDAAPAEAYRGEQPTRVRMTSSPRYPLIISDSPETTR